MRIEAGSRRADDAIHANLLKLWIKEKRKSWRKKGLAAVVENFGAHEGEPLRLPEDAALPEMAFLAEHRRRIFR